MKGKIRVKLRFVHLRASTSVSEPAPASTTISNVLHQLLIAARWGAHDGNDLFNRFSKNGLSPRWINVLQIRVEDPVAGPLFVCFEPVVLTAH